MKTGKLTINKLIPKIRLNRYLNLGWNVISSEGDSEVMVQKTMITNSGIPERCSYPPVVRIYLVQRGRICRPLGKYTDSPLSSAVQLDYMGSAEFEFGALPRSLRRMEAQFHLYDLYVVEDILGAKDGKTFPLRVYANFDSPEQFESYKNQLRAMVRGNILLKERTYLNWVDGVVPIPERFDFWWDIENDVFFSFDKIFMSRIPNHVQHSFRVLNSPREMDEESSAVVNG